jgi:hypothetical protein
MNGQQGRRHRLTAAEIECVRVSYRRMQAVRAERLQLINGLNLTRDEYFRIGRGKLGKKPRSE